MYNLPDVEQILAQGDVIDDCPLAVFASDEETDPWTVSLSRIVVLSQSCDLAQAKSTRVVVAPVYGADLLVERGILKSNAIRDGVRRGLVFGWYFLPALEALSVVESIVNLRELHTINRTTLEHLVLSNKRAFRIISPYREHLAQHFAVTYMRIALPEPYPTDV